MLVALIGALVLAGLAGAQRTRTAVDRMIESNEIADVLVNPEQGDESGLDFDEIATLPMVENFSRVQGVANLLPGDATADNVFTGPLTLAIDANMLVEFERPAIAAGRVPDPQALDEVFLDRTYAAQEGISVGDTVVLSVVPYEVILDAYPLLFGDNADAALALFNDPAVRSTVNLTVVGIGNGLDGIVVDEGYEPFAQIIGPALYEHLGEPSAGYGGAVVQLTDPSELSAFKAAVDAMVPEELVVYQTRDVSRAKALRATEPAGTALAIFAAITAVLGTLLIGQAASRRFQLDARDNTTLAALGATRTERFVTSMIRLVLAALVGLVLAVVAAALLSYFTPVGPAEFAEPDPGFDVAGGILLGGGLLLFVVFVAAGTLPAWNNARQHAPAGALRGSATAGWLAAHGASPGLTNGVRFGLEPGRGQSAVPTRATIIGAVTAIAVAAGTVVFASSLDRVVSDGRFYGSEFDVAVDFEFDDAEVPRMDDLVALVASDRAVERVAELLIVELTIDGDALTAMSFVGTDASITPVIAEGRAPLGADEVALGLTTMRRLGVGIGDTVSLTADGFDGDAVVVGRAVLPAVGLYSGSDRTSIGVGAVVGAAALGPRTVETKSFIIADLRADSSSAQATDEFAERLSSELGIDGFALVQQVGKPSDIEGLVRLRSLPVVLASLLVLVVGVTVANAMVVAVRRRRRDIAILQTLGSTRGEVTAVGVWQGITVGVVGLIVGVPVGVVAGRWFWTRLANGFGTLAEPVVPVATLIVLMVAVLVLAAASGYVPIRRGLRHRPAQVLRDE